MTAIACQGIDSMLSRSSYCTVYGDGPGEEYWPCLEWASKFHILVWFYLAFALITR